MDDYQRSLRSSHHSPIEEPREGRFETLLQFPLLFQQLNIIDAETLTDLMAIVNQAHTARQFKITQDTDDGQDGEGEFLNITYEPFPNPTEDQPIPKLLLPLVLRIPAMKDIMSWCELTRTFIWTSPFDDPYADHEGTVFRWHRDGRLTMAIIFVWYVGNLLPNYRGAEVRIGTRIDMALPVDVILNVKKPIKRTTRSGKKFVKTKTYKFTAKDQYVSMDTPHGSMYVIFGGVIPHAVQQVMDAGIRRYGAVFFFKISEAKRTEAARQWLNMLRQYKGDSRAQ
jgi:hypothetical protein